MVFRWGQSGLGYYRDDGPMMVLSLQGRPFPLAECQPVTLSLDKLIAVKEWCLCDLLSPTPFDQRSKEVAVATAVGRRRRRKRKAEVREAREDVFGAEGLSWPDDGTVSAATKDHSRAGWWASDCFNPNAWADASKTITGWLLLHRAGWRKEAGELLGWQWPAVSTPA